MDGVVNSIFARRRGGGDWIGHTSVWVRIKGRNAFIYLIAYFAFGNSSLHVHVPSVGFDLNYPFSRGGRMDGGKMAALRGGRALLTLMPMTRAGLDGRGPA